MQTLKGSSPESKSLVPTILKTHLIALVGAVSFLLLNAPLPWLFGPLTSCLITAVLGFELKVYKPLYVLNTKNNISSLKSKEQDYFADCVKSGKTP